MDLQLTDKLALVTGSTAGIGYAIAEALAREGVQVILNGRSQAGVDEAVTKIKATTGKDTLSFAGDLISAKSAEALIRQHPNIEILINNLGIFEPKPFEDILDADWMRFFDVNVLSGVRLARLCLPAMKRINWGRIVFISSESDVQIPSEMIHYGVTKTAQLAVSRGLAEAVAGTGITVNSILPGPTKSRGVGDFVGRAGGGEREIVCRIREGVLRDRQTDIADQAIRQTRGGGIAGDLHRKPTVVSHNGSCASRRWRRGQERVLSCIIPSNQLFTRSLQIRLWPSNLEYKRIHHESCWVSPLASHF